MGEGLPAPAGARSQARRAAVEALYEADMKGVPASRILEAWETTDRTIRTFTRELVAGVEANVERLDALIERRAEGWSLERLAAIDHAVLRVALHEILDRDDIPVAVAISEAVNAAKELSTDESGAFVNGILGRIAREDILSEKPGAAGAAATEAT